MLTSSVRWSCAALAAVAALAVTVSACTDDGAVPASTAAPVTARDRTLPPVDATDGPPRPAPLPGTGQSVRVSAIDNTFRPGQIEVLAGTEVLFTNDGRNDHDIIPADQRPGDELAWGAEVDDFVPRDTYRVVFEQPGTYDYYCSIHGTSTAGMVGTITVIG